MHKQSNYKIEIIRVNNAPLALLKKNVFGWIWIVKREAWLLSFDDFEVIEYWMDKYKIPNEQVKELEVAC